MPVFTPVCQRWWQILETLQQRYPQQPVAVQLGLSVQAAHLGVLGYLVLACENQALSMLAVLPQQDDLIERLRKALLKALQSGQANSAFVARQLNVSERTLFRRLQQYGFSFKQILMQTRTELAKKHLQAGQLTLAEIALLLGYSEQSAFNRAFKRETGLTPRQFQRR
ncbi:helix-turn-helix transcriptional regulator [Bacterioplanoides pacificum]|uniref:Helix-turn-helix domain-containing protein n=1 Tax=Bacterioplanoides pacificum TaxID=1171596 RepID=A0ABV7VQ03_9GAMM